MQVNSAIFRKILKERNDVAFKYIELFQKTKRL